MTTQEGHPGTETICHTSNGAHMAPWVPQWLESSCQASAPIEMDPVGREDRRLRPGVVER